MAVHVWPTPKNPQDIKSFLGLCGFYQRFVPDYATAAAPMTDLMRKKNVWEWGTAQQLSFETIKARMLKAPVLTVPDFDKPLVLHTDASDVDIGATLSQKGEDGNMQLIACRSRKMSDAE